MNRRILLVRLGSLGDLVHALPIVASTRTAWPEAELDWVVDHRHRALLDLVPGLTDRIVIDTRRLGGPSGWVTVMRRLRARAYDIAFDAQGLLKSAVIARGSGAGVVVGFAAHEARERAASWFYTTRVDPAPARHVVDRNLALVRDAGVGAAVRAFPLQVPTPTDAVRRIVAACGERFAVLNPGAAWPNKRWPAERFAALASRMRRELDCPAVVTWGPEERALAERLVSEAGGAAVAAPSTTLHELVSLLGSAALVVAGDTGPLHLAAALGRPVVGLFGPTDPARNGPWNSDDVSVSRSERCTCFHKRRCRARRWCLDDLGIDEVFDAVARRLATPRGVSAA